MHKLLNACPEHFPGLDLGIMASCGSSPIELLDISDLTVDGSFLHRGAVCCRAGYGGYISLTPIAGASWQACWQDWSPAFSIPSAASRYSLRHPDPAGLWSVNLAIMDMTANTAEREQYTS